MILSPALAKFAACCLAFLLLSPAAAQERVPARPDREYRLIEPRPVAGGERIEVIEFFWYGCPYCHELQPLLEAWLARRASDIVLHRVPALLSDARVPHARIYYALEALGELGRLHQQVYRDYHPQLLPLGSPDAAAQWAVRQGIDRARWIAAYQSEEVSRKVQQAQELTKLYDVRGTPTLVVDGRYLTSSGMAGGVRNLMPVADELVRIARQRRAER